MKKFEIRFHAENKNQLHVNLTMIVEGKNEQEAGLFFNKFHAGKDYKIDRIKEIVA
ncbi:hypothetical protein [Xenorhabdus entomophaga]|uniref:hypothetical protein n=1 Tax=Xenorhabdus entomophaga TaxID=3136257 RepID=UPI0030F395C7